LLLNDLVVCVSVTPRSTEDFSGNERLTLKWTYPVSDIEVCKKQFKLYSLHIHYSLILHTRHAQNETKFFTKKSIVP